LSRVSEIAPRTGSTDTRQTFSHSITQMATTRTPRRVAISAAAAITLPQATVQLALVAETRVIGEIVMRDIRGDLQERANFIEDQIRGTYAHFEKVVQQLMSERDAKVAELQGAHTMMNKLIEFEDGFMDNVVTLSNPQTPRLSLAKRIKAASG
jgi:hypothetical protein